MVQIFDKQGKRQLSGTEGFFEGVLPVQALCWLAPGESQSERSILAMRTGFLDYRAGPHFVNLREMRSCRESKHLDTNE